MPATSSQGWVYTRVLAGGIGTKALGDERSSATLFEQDRGKPSSKPIPAFAGMTPMWE
jgi:hypothetical protein